MALDDVVGDLPDFSGDSVLDRVTRSIAPDLPQGAGADAILNRLNRKLATPEEAEKAKARRAAKPEVPDLSSYGKPADQREDLSSFGTPADQVPIPQPRPAGAPPTSIGLSGNVLAAAKGIPTGALEATGGALKGSAQAINQAQPYLESLQYDPMGNVIGQAPVQAPAPVENNPLYRAGQAVEGAAPTMSPAERESMGGRLGTMAGGIAPYAAATLVNPALGLAAGFTGMAADTYGKVYEDAKAKGATEEQAQGAAGKSAAVAGVLGSLPLGAGKYAQSLAAKVVASSAAFATMGEAQEALLQQIAKDYDPKAGYTLDQKRLIAELILGAGMGGLHHAFRDRGPVTQAERVERPQPQEPIDTTATEVGGEGGGLPPPASAGPGPQPEPGPQPGGPGAGNAGTESTKPPPGTGEGMGPGFTMDPQTRAKMERVYRHFEPGKNPADLADHELYNAVNEHLRDTSSTGYTAKPETEEEARAREATATERTEREALKRRGWTDAHINAMTPEQRRKYFQEAMAGAATPPPKEEPAYSNSEHATEAKPESGTREEPPQAATPPQGDTGAGVEKKPGDKIMMRMFNPATGAADKHRMPFTVVGQRKNGDYVIEHPVHGRIKATAEHVTRAIYATDEDLRTGHRPDEGTREAPARPATASDVAALTPAEPTPAQAEAENFRHAHLELEQFGLTGKNSISVETGVGQERKGVGKDGKPWSVTLEHGAYGRIKGTKGADGQPLDVFVGPHPKSPYAFIIDQHEPETGQFDEHKVMLGYRTPIDALHAYANSYTDGGKDRIGHVTAMGPEEFQTWLKGDTSRALKPVQGTGTADSAPATPAPTDRQTNKGGVTARLPLTEVPSEGAVDETPKVAPGGTGARPSEQPGTRVTENPATSSQSSESTRQDQADAEAAEQASEIANPHKAVEEALGGDAEHVAPVDIARAAELMEEHPGMDPATAFGHAVIESAVGQKFLTSEQAEQAYGKEVHDVLGTEREGTPGGGAHAEQGGAAPDQERAGGAKEAGELPRRSEAREGKAEQAKPAADEGTAKPATPERPAAGRKQASGNEASNAATTKPTAEPADNAKPVGEDHGVQAPVHGGHAGPESKAVPETEGQRATRPLREPESEGGKPPVAGDHGGQAEDLAGREGGRGASEEPDVRVPGRHEQPAEGRAEGPVQRDARAVKGENYHIEPGALGEDRSPLTKAKDNVAAIKLANKLIEADRPATAEEQHQLARYVGWGGLKGAFPDADGNFAKGYEALGAELRNILSPEEYDTARRSIQYAHYTAADVIDAMWDIARRLGFTGGTVFEPGMGVGHFAGLMPRDLADRSAYHGIEMDHVTSRIAKLLYPNWGVRQADFTKVPLAENAFDLAIGNPPFGDITIHSDPKYKQGFLLHDYFFAKSLDAVRPGGLLAFVTSAGTMNKTDPTARQYLADRANFVGGIRLPSDAFKKNAGTEVTTDILIFRKLMPDEKPADQSWLKVARHPLPGPDGKIIQGLSNRYFIEHPEMVLGEPDFADKLYKGRYSVKAKPGQDLKAELARAVDNLARNQMKDAETPREKATYDFEGNEKKDGSYYLKDGKLYQHRAGLGVEVARRGKGVEGGKTAGEIERIAGLVPVRDALRETFAADLAGDDTAAKRARAKLNKAYDTFVAKFGPINKAEIQRRRPNSIQEEAARSEAREEARYAGTEPDEGTFDPRPMIAAGKSLAEIARARKAAIEAQGAAYKTGTFDPDELPDVILDKRPNIDPFADDQESYRLRAIEKYDEPSGKAEKGPVFFHNVVSKDQPPQINSVHDAVLHTLNQKGRLDLDAVAALAKKSRTEAIEALGDRIYQVPGTKENWETAEQYLSGNVRKKLALAKAEAQRNPAFRRNVEALEAAQPAPLAPSQIGASLGMPWIPSNYIEQFATEELGLGSLKANYVPSIATWSVSGDENSVASTSDWGTSRRNAVKLMLDALNRQSPKIFDQVDEKTTMLNAAATQAAQEKMQAIKDRFNDWIFKDEKRADRLANLYNENYNNLVVQEFNGDYLTTPGISAEWSWRPHQKRVIARIIQNGNTYMAHAVGAGKTSAMIGAGMEMRRLGLVKKPMYAVPNHMLAQFTKEFYEQYPTARIAVADERQFHTDRRKQFMANVALNDLDAVIITHSAFGLIPVSDEFQDQIINEELEEYRKALLDTPKNFDNRITRSRIEKQIERLEQRLSGRATKKKDKVFNFDEMGVDFLFVDEAHQFRKLDFNTQMSNLKGITPQGSAAAWDLYVKSKLLESRNPGRNLVLASGTPVTNTMAELYTVSRYLQRKELYERGLQHFDAWAGAFGDNVTELEQDAAGGYKPVSRFAKFVNVAELSSMVRQIMDVVTSRQLEQYVVRPKLKGGKRIMNLADKSPALTRYQADLAARMKKMEGRGKPQPGDDIMLKVIGDGRHAAIDLRLVGGTPDPDFPSKLDLLVDNVARIWQQTRAQKLYKPKNGAYDMANPADTGPATQMIFANLGISGTRGFSVPDYIRAELVRRGVPRNEIAFIADFKSHVQKQKLFNDMNEGKVRVLVGSTAKMATGVNAQRRLFAVHNLDPLWYPSDDEQRNGRAIRQGNMNPEIEIHDYSTKGTYDSTMWGMMEKKARFIQGFFEGDPSLRSMDDLGEASQYEQAKALTTNDPRLMRLTELRQEYEKANRRKAAFDNERHAIRQKQAQARSDVQHYEGRAVAIEKDIAQRVPLAGDAFTAKIGKESFDKRVEFADALMKAIDKVTTKENSGRHIPIGEISGFMLIASPQKIADEMDVNVNLQRNGGAQSHITVGTSGLGAVRSMESVISGFDSDLAYAKAKIATNKKFLAESEGRENEKFKGGDDIANLRKQIDELVTELAKKEEPPAAPTEEAPRLEQSASGPVRDYAAPATVGSRGGLGAAAQAHVLALGRETKTEHLIAYDANGDKVDNGKMEGTKFAVAIDPKFLDRLHDPNEAIVIHHNHPVDTNTSFSPADLAVATLPGTHSLWAHAHNGDIYRIEVLPRARAVAPKAWRDRAVWADRIFNNIKEGIIPSLQKAWGQIDKVEAERLWGHLVQVVLSDAGFSKYSANVDDEAFRASVPGLNEAMEQMARVLSERLNNVPTSGIHDRRAKPIRHPGEVGTVFDRDQVVAPNTEPQSGHPQRGQDHRGEEGARLAQDSHDNTIADILGTRLLGKLGELNATEIRTQLQDKFIRVKHAEESVGAPPSTYQAESLYYGRTGQRLESLNTHHIEPLIRDMKARDIDLNKLDNFLKARHAPERNNAIGAMHPAGHPFNDAINNHNVQGGSGWSTNEALRVIRDIRQAGKLPDYQAIAAKVDAINYATRRRLYDAGLISRETFEAWNNAYRYYVPLRGFAEGTEDEAAMARQGAGYNIRGKEAKQAFGRKSEAASPLAYSIMQAEMAIVRAEKNKVGNTFLKFVRDNPDRERWVVDRPEQIRRLDPNTGLVTTVPNNLSLMADNVFSTKVQGRTVNIRLLGPDGVNLARALKNMGAANVHKLIRVYSTLTHTMAKLATSFNPDFMIPNLARDFGEAFINLQAQDQRRFVRNFVKHMPGAMAGSMAAIAGKTPAPGSNLARYVEAFHRFDEAGGRVRFFGIDDPDRIETNVTKKLKRLQGGPLNTLKDIGDKAAKALEVAGGGIENATRLAAFMAAKDAGFSDADAAMLARNLTVDFNKKGELGGAISALYMFANAGVQGQARMIRSMGSRRVWAAVGALAGASALSALYSLLMSDTDEAGTPDYMKIPPWERDKNLIFMLPGHNYLKIPLPYGFSPFAVIGAHSVNVLMGHEKPLAAASAIIHSALDAFNPLGEESSMIADVVPSALRPLYHIEANKNWTGKPLYPEQDKFKGQKPNSTQSFKSDSGFSKEAALQLNKWSGGDAYTSGAIDVHPGSIDHVLQAMGGGVAKFVMNLSASLYSGIKGEEWQPEKTPILRRFIGKVGEDADRYAYYDKRQEVMDKKAAVDQARKDLTGPNKDAASAYLKDNPQAGLQAEVVKRTDSQLKSLRAQEERIKNSAMGDAEKRLATDTIHARMRSIENRARATLQQQAR